MVIYDINGNSLVISGGVSTNVDLGEISTTVKQEENNLFALYSFKEGYYLSNGTEKENANYAVSDFIPCEENTNIRFEFKVKNIKPTLFCYDGNKSYIGDVVGEYSVVDENQTLITLENTKYIKFSVGKNYVSSINAFMTQDVTYYELIDTAQKRWKLNEDNTDRDNRLSGIDALIYNYTKWNGKSLVTDGNSLVESTNWGNHLASFLGMTHTNCGNSGSMITRPEDTMDTIKANIADNYPIATDLVILQGDTNGAMDGEVSDQMDDVENPKTTWTARMNYLIRCIRAKYPNVVIVMMPDSVRYGYSPLTETGDNGIINAYNYANNGISLQMMRKLAEYNRIIFWNFDGSTPFNPNHNENYYSRYYHENATYGVAQDTVHPYRTYSKAKGYALAHFIAGLVFDPDAPNTAIADWQDKI